MVSVSGIIIVLFKEKNKIEKIILNDKNKKA